MSDFGASVSSMALVAFAVAVIVGLLLAGGHLLPDLSAVGL